MVFMLQILTGKNCDIDNLNKDFVIIEKNISTILFKKLKIDHIKFDEQFN